jgi:hypothetical protein
MPQSFGGFAATMAGLPITMAGEIDEAVPLVGAALREGKGPVVGAVGVHVKSGDRLVDMLTRGEAARFDAKVDQATRITLLSDKVAPESAKVALGVLGNYLLVGQKPADLLAVGPYVARTLSVAPVPKEEIALEIAEPALGGPILDAVKELRGHAETGAAALVPVGGLLDGLVSLLGDAKHARLTLALDGAAVHGRATVAPKPGNGPGSKLVADLAVGDAKPLLELPDTTTLGILWRESAAARTESAGKQGEALLKLLGKEAGAEDKSAISAALGAEAEARGDWLTVGVAFNGTGPTAAVRAPVSDAEKMKKALKQLVDLTAMASFKKALADLGLRLTSEKTVVENLAGEVMRVRFARVDPAAKDDKGKGEKPKGDAKGKDDKAKKAPEPPAAEVPSAVDLLYTVNADGLYASAGFDPKESLRTLTRAAAGSSLGKLAPMASALAQVGSDATFVLVADALRIDAMTTGRGAPANPAPVVVAAGRTASPAELWGRFDIPVSVVQLMVTEMVRRRSAAPAAPAQ